MKEIETQTVKHNVKDATITYILPCYHCSVTINVVLKLFSCIHENSKLTSDASRQERHEHSWPWGPAVWTRSHHQTDLSESHRYHEKLQTDCSFKFISTPLASANI